VGLGLALVAVGLLLRYAGGLFSWFGNLPGDIRVEGERTSFYAPITSMLILSVVASVVLTILARLFRGE
jgi:membrane protein implicated in regulation of membrane protease activity